VPFPSVCLKFGDLLSAIIQSPIYRIFNVPDQRSDFESPKTYKHSASFYFINTIQL